MLMAGGPAAVFGALMLAEPTSVAGNAVAALAVVPVALLIAVATEPAPLGGATADEAPPAEP